MARRAQRTPANGRRGPENPPTNEAAMPPQMQRSTGQLASSYAPMRHFAFENGLGVCLAVPVEAPALPLEGNTPDQIHRRLREATLAWYRTARSRLERDDPDRARFLRHLLVDESLYNVESEDFEYQRHALGFVAPKRMGYEISPTTLICGTCNLLRPLRSARDMEEFLTGEAASECVDPKRTSSSAKRCRWRQFEPIFVHPSGAWRPVEVDRLDLLRGQDEPTRLSTTCEACGFRQFRVDTSKVVLSQWTLRCAKCGVAQDRWTENDEEYLVAKARAAAEGVNLDLSIFHMEKISYGAAIAYVPHSETFVDLPEAKVLEFIESNRKADLYEFVGKICGYHSELPTPGDAIAELSGRGPNARELAERIEMAIETASLPGRAERSERQIRSALEEAFEKGFLKREVRTPQAIKDKIDARSELWASRYDPFQQAVEYSALADTKLSARNEGARRSFVRFTHPDQRLAPWDEASGESERNSGEVRAALTYLGIEEAGLIPRFELCRFTYGYSRTSSTPTHPKRAIPVRLKLFPKISVGGQNVHPVYVLRQKNEAFFFRLDPKLVREWLLLLRCADASLLESEPSLTAALFMSAHPMDRFLAEHDALASDAPRLYAAAYGLVHSMAHHVIRTLSRLSGLDESGLGEYLFPTDLAFVVYRSGMTMDLGDLSALWRNSWRTFLDELRQYPDTLGCNVGSLCAEQGAACPDCLMIPEVTCVAGNRYLSRALLTGEGRPSFMNTDARRITGYLELALRRPSVEA